MLVIRSKVLGFCMGVRRAVELAAAEAERGVPVYTIGSLIHNPGVLSDLKKLGVQALGETPENMENRSVIIRAHGIEPRVEDDLRGRGARIVDATCPKVKASQLKAESLSRAGYCLFLAGEGKHAEITGILGYSARGYAEAADATDANGAGNAGACSFIVNNAAEAQAAAKKLLNERPEAKTALIGQTTISEEEYRAIGEEIKKYFPALEIVQTICAATADRQQALREMLPDVDAVLIAGGRESANTQRLLAIAGAAASGHSRGSSSGNPREGGKPCALVESAGEIPAEFKTYRTVGLSAGASTPDSVIDEIEKELLR